MSSVSARQRLTPTQARTVADRRRADAGALQSFEENRHANGVMYLAGIAVELLLKARLLEKHPWLTKSPASSLGARQRRLWDVCYRWHDLEAVRENLPELDAQLHAISPRLLEGLKKLCAEWTIHIRYSTHQATRKESAAFLARLEELIPWLKSRK